jgi:hypothetical protein
MNRGFSRIYEGIRLEPHIEGRRDKVLEGRDFGEEI